MIVYIVTCIASTLLSFETVYMFGQHGPSTSSQSPEFSALIILVAENNKHPSSRETAIRYATENVQLSRIPSRPGSPSARVVGVGTSNIARIHGGRAGAHSIRQRSEGIWRKTLNGDVIIAYIDDRRCEIHSVPKDALRQLLAKHADSEESQVGAEAVGEAQKPQRKFWSSNQSYGVTLFRESSIFLEVDLGLVVVEVVQSLIGVARDDTEIGLGRSSAGGTGLVVLLDHLDQHLELRGQLCRCTPRDCHPQTE